MDTLHSSSRTVIVGAGLTGLMLANRLGPMAHKLTLIEKSRGVGGRMATRRSEAARFLITAPSFIRSKPRLRKFTSAGSAQRSALTGSPAIENHISNAPTG